MHRVPSHLARALACAISTPKALLFKDPATVSFNKFGITPTAIRNLCAGSWFALIVDLDLSANQITETSATVLARSFAKWPHLKTLVVDGTPITPAISDAGAITLVTGLLPSSVFEKLSLRLNQLSANVGHVVAALVSASRSLKVLDLHGNRFRDDGALEIATAMQSDASALADVDLSDNVFTEAGGMKVIHALTNNTTCTRLGLGTNYMGKAGGACIATLLNKHPSLAVLEIQWSNLSCPDVALISKQLERTNSPATRLNLSHNNLSTPHCTTMDSGGVVLARMLERNRMLTHLNLQETKLIEADAIAIGAMLAVNSTLLELNLSSNDIGSIGGKALTHGLEMNQTVDNLSISGGKSIPIDCRIRLLNWRDAKRGRILDCDSSKVCSCCRLSSFLFSCSGSF
jgi:hypothetical protein